MPEKFSKEKRSEIMRQVKSRRNESTELKLIQFFKENKIKGWRRNYKVFGKPDFVFIQKKIAVFVDGCFWHGHNCRNLTPSQNGEYWKAKINRNMKRDTAVNEYFLQKGWKVTRIWECNLKKSDYLLTLLNSADL